MRQQRSSQGEQDGLNLHASCVACHGRAALIQGKSGAGKSTLALHLLSLGADLVSDDRTVLWRGRDGVMADAPEPLRGLIEARGVGILRALPAGPTPVALVIDLDADETERLPERRETQILGQSVPLLHRVDAPHFAPAILQYLAHGREA
ncbi:HPr kinase/phosphatase C-terminal domain-containing protein [Shimia sp. SDUM112013]|uniref:HPr kinase/phosphorylase n=1 Tax=Shimia sp. SDUM112013 TaxID=3136160 RepID=UPI0032EACB78